MYVIIAGSRLLLKHEVYNVLNQCPISSKITTVISGKAKSGGDFWGEQWALERNLPIIPFPADWYNVNVENVFVKPGTNYNSLAGFNRNLEMAKFAKEHNGRLIAIYKGKSSGTKDMVTCAKKLGILVYVYEIVN